MGRIKITDLPKDMKLSEEDLRKVRGGALALRSIGLGLPGSLQQPARLRLIGGIPSLQFGIDQRDWKEGPV